MPTRAPSLDLLRVLRRTVYASTTPGARQPCLAHRSFVTTPQRCADSQPKSTTSPPAAAAAAATTTSGSFTTSSSSSSSHKSNPYAPRSHDRGPMSKEDTQTDFGVMDIYANVPNPATSIDACTSDGFHLDNGIKITGYAGLMVAGGEAWSWRPWLALTSSSSDTPTPSSQISSLLDPRRGILTIPKQSLGLFSVLHPKPDLLFIGTGSRLWMLSPDTKRYLTDELGVRVDVMDTANASAAYNLLAKERGVEGGAGVGGVFLPIGWKGPETKTNTKTTTRTVRKR